MLEGGASRFCGGSGVDGVVLEDGYTRVRAGVERGLLSGDLVDDGCVSTGVQILKEEKAMGCDGVREDRVLKLAGSSV